MLLPLFRFPRKNAKFSPPAHNGFVTETYTAVSPDATLGFLVSPLILAIALVWQKVTGRRSKFVSRSSAGIAIWALVSTFFRAPMVLQFVGLVAIPAIGILVSPGKSPSIAFRLPFALGLIALALGQVLIYRDDRITLHDDSVSYRSAGDQDRSVPRAGLRLHALGGEPRWFDPWGTYSWTTYSKGTPGPYLSGSMCYWGPHGLVRGDDLARHLADWAGVKPVYQTSQEFHASMAP